MSESPQRDPETGQFTTADSSPWTNKETLYELYHEEGLSLSEIGDTLDCGQTTVLYWMDKHDIQRRKANDEKPPAYCVERGWPVWSHRIDGIHRTVRVHRLIAVAYHGFEAVAGMDVHHKNGVRWDNRPTNLTPIDHGEHTSLHRQRDGGITKPKGGDE